MCDAFLVLAQTDSGISCFLMPRWTPDGERNRFHIQRLKDKLGNRSNASSEVEFRGAWARLVGEEGRGVPTIIEMVNHTRLDCVIGATAGYRAGVVQALHHAAHRSAFGAELIDQPLMRNVLADLCVESEAATVSAMRLARSYDEVAAGEEEAIEFRRLANPVLKYWLCKRAPAHAVECLECLGGNGYVEESGMPRLFRESPLASIWEGSGNVQCLDVCGRWSRARPRWRPSSPKSCRPPAPSPGSTPTSAHCATRSPATSRRSSTAPAASSSEWRSPCRPRCCSATATRPSPTPSARPASPAMGSGLRHPAGRHGLHPHHRAPPPVAASRSARPTCSAVITPLSRPSASTAIRAPKRRRFWFARRESAGRPR